MIYQDSSRWALVPCNPEQPISIDATSTMTHDNTCPVCARDTREWKVRWRYDASYPTPVRWPTLVETHA
jgi:hypothetical protein